MKLEPTTVVPERKLNLFELNELYMRENADKVSESGLMVKSVKERLANHIHAPLDSFPVFLRAVFPKIGLPTPSPIQMSIAEFLGDFDYDSKCIMGFRGVAKSTITTCFAAWCFLMDPHLKIVVVSQTMEMAKQIAEGIKNILKNVDFLRHLAPDGSGGEKDNAISMDIKGTKTRNFEDTEGKIQIQPSLKCISISGQKQGNRPDIVIFDDVETFENSLTESKRNSLEKNISDFSSQLTPGGIKIVLGTPQLEDSQYLRMEKTGFKLRIWPARMPSMEQRARSDYWGRIAPIIQECWTPEVAWKPVEPSRFPHEELEKRAKSIDVGGYAGFQLQFMLDTTLSDAEKYEIKCENFTVMDFDSVENSAPVKVVWGKETKLDEDNELPCLGMIKDGWYRPISVSKEWAPYEKTVMFIDPSGQAGENKDETAVAIASSLGSKIFIRKVIAFQDGYGKETLKAIAELSKLYAVNAVVIEKNFGDGMFGALLTPEITATGRQVSIVSINSKGQKEKRIMDVLAPATLQHKVIFLQSVLEEDLESVREIENKLPGKAKNYSLVYQMTRLTRAKGALSHDDRVEALAGVVGQFIDMLKVQEEESQAIATEQLMRDNYWKGMADAGYTAKEIEEMKLRAEREEMEKQMARDRAWANMQGGEDMGGMTDGLYCGEDDLLDL